MEIRPIAVFVRRGRPVVDCVEEFVVRIAFCLCAVFESHVKLGDVEFVSWIVDGDKRGDFVVGPAEVKLHHAMEVGAADAYRRGDALSVFAEAFRGELAIPLPDAFEVGGEEERVVDGDALLVVVEEVCCALCRGIVTEWFDTGVTHGSSTLYHVVDVDAENSEWEESDRGENAVPSTDFGGDIEGFDVMCCCEVLEGAVVVGGDDDVVGDVSVVFLEEVDKRLGVCDGLGGAT